MLNLKEDKFTKYIIAWKSKGLFKSRLYPLYTTLLPNIKGFGYKIGIQINNTSLVVERSNYVNVNDYIFYNLN